MTVDFAFYVHWSHSDLAPTEISSATATPPTKQTATQWRRDGEFLVDFCPSKTSQDHIIIICWGTVHLIAAMD